MGDIELLKDGNGHISRDNIRKIVPYGDKFLFLDEVVSLTRERIVAIKKIRESDEYLKAHFTSFQLMPGVLIIESLGQASALLARYRTHDHQKKHILAYTIKEAKFFAPVLPNQEMSIEVEIKGEHNHKMLFEGLAQVKGETVASISLVAAIVDAKEFEKRGEG
jgi:3-hydroxyacyl-[acyl-carrier-protein] dehydratase